MGDGRIILVVVTEIAIVDGTVIEENGYCTLSKGVHWRNLEDRIDLEVNCGSLIFFLIIRNKKQKKQ